MNGAEDADLTRIRLTLLEAYWRSAGLEPTARREFMEQQLESAVGALAPARQAEIESCLMREFAAWSPVPAERQGGDAPENAQLREALRAALAEAPGGAIPANPADDRVVACVQLLVRLLSRAWRMHQAFLTDILRLEENLWPRDLASLLRAYVDSTGSTGRTRTASDLEQGLEQMLRMEDVVYRAALAAAPGALRVVIRDLAQPAGRRERLDEQLQSMSDATLRDKFFTTRLREEIRAGLSRRVEDAS